VDVGIKKDFFRFGITGGFCLSAALAFAACSSSGDDDDMNPAGGSGGTTMSNAGSGGSMMVQTGTGGAKAPGTGGTTAGTGGTTAGTGGTTAGTGGAGPITLPDDAGVPLAEGFDCVQGGASWGKPEQSGPCKTITTTYGVKFDLGPYGASSEYNVGSGANGSDFQAAFPIGGCGTFIDGFGADPVGSMDLKDVHDLDFDKFTVFYPGKMADEERFPLITWGNGTCAMPEGYGPLLRYVASFGYIIVAANDLATGDGTSMRKGLDFMLAENDDPNSKYYHHIDPDKIGAMGHSQGAGATVSAAADPRIKAIIAWNSGTSPDKPFLNVSGDRDIGGTPSGNKNATDGAPQPGAWLWYHQIPQNVNGSTTGETAPGHLTLMMEPERVKDVALNWWNMWLKDDADAKAWFVGDSCKLCDGNALPSMWAPFRADSQASPAIEYGHNSMLQ
jgi:hypothetical protein